MRKFIFVIAFIICFLVYKNDDIIIPIDSIRVRIISNSNNISDFNDKILVKNNIESYLYNIVSDSNNISEARNSIVKNIDNISNRISSNYKGDFNINYGYNYFPNKEFKGVKYNSGMYESLVITLGSGMGDNWWCVLFPPLCFVNEEETEYKSLVSELLGN